MKHYKYFNRDLSWLSFNHRVLEEAADKQLPLYERIKFLAIYSSNLEEFYRVRVAYYRNLMNMEAHEKPYDPTDILHQINEEVSKQLVEFGNIFENGIIPELAHHNIILWQNEELSEPQSKFLHSYFSVEVLPQVQPVLLESGNILSFLQNNFIYIAVKLLRKKKKKKKKLPKYAIIKVPTHYLPRFIELPECGGKYYIMFLEDLIIRYIHELFPGYEVLSHHCIQLSRDADLYLEDEESHGIDFEKRLRESLAKRKVGAPSRFLYDKNIPVDLLEELKTSFGLRDDDMVQGGTYHNFASFFSFPNPYSPNLELIHPAQIRHAELDSKESLFDAIKEKDWMLHFPYHTYDYVIKFLNQAAIDPNVEEIKTIQYRVATNSAIVSALISAAKNGKKVTVFVEYQARFDEETNLQAAKQMKKAGIKIISSIPGIKVHAKLALVLRRSGKDKTKLRGFSFIATGNFNEKTAKLYADKGFFTYNQEIAEEINLIFKILGDWKHTEGVNLGFKHLLVGMHGLKQGIIAMIEREISNVANGGSGYMILKMNGLEDLVVIDKLYEASKAGVKIDLLVRGVCCLIPNMEYSKNITVTRIIDRYLEHARVFVFYNNGRNDVYISSADWMKRNLNRRVETAAPIYDEALKSEVIDILKIQLMDNTKACYLNEHMQNIRKLHDGEDIVQAQVAIYDYISAKESKTIERLKAEKNMPVKEKLPDANISD